MKVLPKIVLGILLAIGVFSSVFYFSCSKDVCKTVNCLHGGSCSAGLCNCTPGWTGTFCETPLFTGNWNGTDMCDNNKTYNFSISIDPYTTDTSRFIIKTPHGYPAQVIATRFDSVTLKIRSQLCDTVMLSGTMILTAADTLTFNYNITDTNRFAVYRNCSGMYSRQ